MTSLILFLQALACLLHPPAPFVQDGIAGKWFSPDTWATLQTLDGHDLWLGYANGGWLTTGDEVRRYTLRGEGYEVWIYHSATRQQYDLLPFTNTALFADANGEHYGMHPCGGWAIDDAILRPLIGESFSWKN